MACVTIEFVLLQLDGIDVPVAELSIIVCPQLFPLTNITKSRIAKNLKPEENLFRVETAAEVGKSVINRWS